MDMYLFFSQFITKSNYFTCYLQKKNKHIILPCMVVKITVSLSLIKIQSLLLEQVQNRIPNSVETEREGSWKLVDEKVHNFWTASTFNDIFLGYMPGQVVKRQENQHFKNHLHPDISTLRTRTKMVLETLFFFSAI
jgi:hypothetical protein